MATDLHALRQAIKAKRAQLSLEQQAHAAQNLAKRILQEKCFQQAQHIGVYYPFAGEISLLNLVDQYRTQDANNPAQKQFYFPLIAAEQMVFVRVHADSQWQTNRFGILEPRSNEVISAKDLDLVFCPLVAFDHQHNRIGQGGGYYDRYFSYKTTEPQAKPKLIGVAYDFQAVNTIQPEPWDIPMDAIFSEGID